METVWQRGPAGVTVTEIWQTISAARPVGRTTVRNLVHRLERRGWLVRRPDRKPYRYVASLDREATATLLAVSFVDDFFGGSASELVMSLLGSRQFTANEVEALRRLLESASSQRDKTEAEQS
jgi:predicted transcriptional regulator